jgi:hypothetical protein
MWRGRWLWHSFVSCRVCVKGDSFWTTGRARPAAGALFCRRRRAASFRAPRSFFWSRLLARRSPRLISYPNKPTRLCTLPRNPQSPALPRRPRLPPPRPPLPPPSCDRRHVAPSGPFSCILVAQGPRLPIVFLPPPPPPAPRPPAPCPPALGPRTSRWTRPHPPRFHLGRPGRPSRVTAAAADAAAPPLFPTPQTAAGPPRRRETRSQSHRSPRPKASPSRRPTVDGK